ncbi:---NA--- [Podarcis lilfordi]|uniref:---NA n=1 Tax=Podarcis lilfordi TaxID=74358 RepID=A0AA35P9E8_9SAUR|nr:---NA--- [Podarcis lilfordi]
MSPADRRQSKQRRKRRERGPEGGVSGNTIDGPAAAPCSGALRLPAAFILLQEPPLHRDPRTLPPSLHAF